MKKIIFVLVFFLAPFSIAADEATTTPLIVPDPVAIYLEIDTASDTLYAGNITVSACPISPGNATSTVNGFCAIEQSGIASTWSYFGEDAFVDSIGGVFNDYVNNQYWGWWDDLEFGMVALNKHELSIGEHLLITIGRFPMRIAVSNAAPEIGATTTVSVVGFGFDASFNAAWSPTASATISYAGVSAQTGTDGTLDIIATSTDPLVVFAGKVGFLSVNTTINPIAASTNATSTPTISPPTENSNSGGGGNSSGGVTPHYQLNIPNALAYVVSKQKPDGSFVSPSISDWAAIAFASSNPGDAKQLLTSYLRSAAPPLLSATDYERHAMALMALGIDPYTGTSVDYIAKITSAFDGVQIGNSSLDNDDIFALFPLLKAGYSTTESIIMNTTAFIVSRQQPSGAWDSSVDMTAAAVQALSLVPDLPGVSSALSKAESFLHGAQQTNGGFGNSFSTSWSLQAIAALGQAPLNWAPQGLNPNDYLSVLQQSDGGIDALSVDTDTRVWATAYAIPGALGMTWSSLLSSFPKPVNISPDLSGDASVIATSTAATTTLAVATSTIPVATSTVPVVQIATTTSVIELAPTTTLTPPPPISTSKTKRIAQKKVTEVVQHPITVAENLRTAATSTTSQQTAGAANAPSGGFLKNLWSAITSFFAKLF